MASLRKNDASVHKTDQKLKAKLCAAVDEGSKKISPKTYQVR